MKNNPYRRRTETVDKKYALIDMFMKFNASHRTCHFITCLSSHVEADIEKYMRNVICL